MKQKFFAFLSRLAFLLILGYLAFLIFSLTRTEYATEPALLCTVTDETSVNGLILRRERVIQSEGNTQGLLCYAKESGARVSKGGLLATVYPSAQQLEAGLAIQELDNAIEKLESLIARPGIGVSGVSEIDGELHTLMLQLCSCGVTGNAYDAAALRSQLVFQSSRRQMAVGTFEDPEGLLQNLKAQRASLGRQISSTQSVTAPAAGFFIDYSDGYETVCTPDLAGKLTVSSLRELKSSPAKEENAIGKLVESYTWYFCCEADKRLADSLSENKTYTLHFSCEPEQDVPALLERITVSGNDGYVLTFSSSRITDELLLARSPTASIVLAEYEGLRIRNDARRVIDGQTGVFVRSNFIMEFRPIEVLYADDLYSVVKWEPGKNTGLRLYDEVVISGKDLYDGKIIT
ncbi:MAG: hypothetical protein IJL39_07055 [Clostridia bacterium]|nr:hypothetical protein [Clostridia bacterium]